MKMIKRNELFDILYNKITKANIDLFQKEVSMDNQWIVWEVVTEESRIEVEFITNMIERQMRKRWEMKMSSSLFVGEKILDAIKHTSTIQKFYSDALKTKIFE